MKDYFVCVCGGGGFSDALIRNLPVITEGPVPQLVLGPSIKMPAANGWAEEAGFPGSCKQAKRHRRRKRNLPCFGGRVTSHVRSWVEWPLVTFLTEPGVAGRRLEMQLS